MCAQLKLKGNVDFIISKHHKWRSLTFRYKKLFPAATIDTYICAICVKIIVSKFYHVNIYPTLSDRARSISAGIAKLRQIIVSNVEDNGKNFFENTSRIAIVIFFVFFCKPLSTYAYICTHVHGCTRPVCGRSRRTYDAGDHPTLRHRHTLSLSRSNARSIATAHWHARTVSRGRERQTSNVNQTEIVYRKIAHSIRSIYTSGIYWSNARDKSGILCYLRSSECLEIRNHIDTPCRFERVATPGKFRRVPCACVFLCDTVRYGKNSRLRYSEFRFLQFGSSVEYREYREYRESTVERIREFFSTVRTVISQLKANKLSISPLSFFLVKW